MNKVIISSVLAATVLVAGMLVFMPIEKASTVHTAIVASTDKLRTAHTIQLMGPITIDTNDFLVLMDLHGQVATDGGFVIVNNPGAAITAANLQVCTTDAAFAVQGTCIAFTQLSAAGVSTPTQTLHAHIPSAAGTILVNLRAINAAVTLPDDTFITVTIDKMT